MGATEAPKLGFEADIKPLFRDQRWVEEGTPE